MAFKKIFRSAFVLFAVFVCSLVASVPVLAASTSTISWPSMPNHGNVAFDGRSSSGGGSFSSSAAYDSTDNWYKFLKSTVPMNVMDFTLKNTGNNVLSDMNPSYTYHVKQEFVVYCNTQGINLYQLISSFSKPVFSCVVSGGGKSSSFEVTSFTGLYGVYVTFEFDLIGFSNVETLRYRIDCGGQSVPACELWLRVSDTQLTVKSPNDDIIEQFGSNYSKPDTSAQDEYEKLESQAMGQIQGGIHDITSKWSGLGGTLLQYQGAFLGFNKFFNNLTGIPWLGTVIMIAVAVGIFGLLLGSIGLIIKRRGD